MRFTVGAFVALAACLACSEHEAPVVVDLLNAPLGTRTTMDIVTDSGGTKHDEWTGVPRDIGVYPGKTVKSLTITITVYGVDRACNVPSVSAVRLVDLSVPKARISVSLTCTTPGMSTGGTGMGGQVGGTGGQGGESSTGGVSGTGGNTLTDPDGGYCPPDAGAPDVIADPGSCETYCNQHLATCGSGAYASQAACLEKCQASQVPLGTVEDRGSNTIGCRIYWLRQNAFPTTCSSVGLSSSSLCGD